MSKFDSPKYDEIKRWIEKRRNQKMSWENIRLGTKSDICGLRSFLNSRVAEDDWPVISIDEWFELVDEHREYEKKQVNIKFRGNEGALYDPHQDNGLTVPENERSSWQLYKNSLDWNRDSIKELEDASIGILRRLSKDTKCTGPIKGLVIGHVQSGKTANMEALMAMAADHGWNMFIVLSGTIENLRLQTLQRMVKDLNHEGYINWIGIEHPSKKSPDGQKTKDLHLKPGSISRYFTVCLKNASRLKHLIDWIHSDAASHSQMRILIIDDEADQASISNNAVELGQEEKERRGINKLIVNLVNDVHYKEDKSKGRAAAMNYVMYTATPYANFLNESTEESLYPQHFVWTLKPSREYIGPNQIFGYDDPEMPDGIDLVRTIPSKVDVPDETESDVEIISDIHDDKSRSLPQSLKDSLCWFFCSVAVMRYWGRKKPISMLIHTSQKQTCHEAVADAVSIWKKHISDSALISMCESVYKEETERLTKEEWYLQNPGYGIPAEEIADYPPFKHIRSYLEDFISEDMKYIHLSDDGEMIYHSGIHLVIDNCSYSGAKNGEDFVRLAYPDPDLDPYPSPAPAFIVIGGNTLSRGLTLEGLVTTYFLRGSCQADTLMQMGRWFGYRRGYELLPRIWMTADTQSKYRFLSILETDLRADLRKYMETEVMPSEYAPRILATPKLTWLRLTAKNKSKNAIPAEMDFSGARPQTVIFDRDKTIQENNLKVTVNFLNIISDKPCIVNGNCLVWEKIEMNLITENLLNKFSFSSRSRVFNEMESFCEWIKQVVTDDNLNNWSVIVAGTGNIELFKTSDKTWTVSGYEVGKVNRSEKGREGKALDPNVADIGALRALKDTVADIDSKFVKRYMEENNIGSINQQDQVDNIRRKAGKADIPLLVIYRIDRHSRPVTASNSRVALDMPCDLIGLHLCIPGDPVNKKYVYKLTVKLPKKKEEEAEEKL